MRQIKFRAWNNADFMSKPFTLRDLQSGAAKLTNECQVMQFTGRKDKNGVEIYEGDRLVFNVRKDKDVVGSKSFANESGVADLTSTGTYFGNWDSIYCENVVIVGNVFKSPELLEGDK